MMRFKLGMLAGAGIAYLVSSGKGRAWLDQAKESFGVGQPRQADVRPMSSPAASVDRGMVAGPATTAFQ